MKILQLCKKFPYPTKDGESIAIMNFSTAFSELGHEVTILALNTQKHYFNPEDLPEELGSQIRFQAVDIDTSVKPGKAFKNLLSNRSYHIERFTSDEFAKRLAELLQNEYFDVIQLEGVYLFAYIDVIRKYSKALVSFRAHNVESEIWQRLAKNTPGLKGWYLGVLAKRMQRFEQQHINSADVFVPISDKDMDTFREWGAKGESFTAPATIDFDRLRPDKTKEQYPAVFFLGALDWIPNIEALNWFLDEVWPQVLDQQPDLKFYIAGRNAGDEAAKWNSPSVEVLGEVDDASEFINSKAVMVTPLLSGSGMRIKIIEAMALGKAVVSTTVGAEGIEYTHGENIMIADEADEFADAINQLVSRKANYDHIARHAMGFAREAYDKLSVSARLLEFYKQHLN